MLKLIFAESRPAGTYPPYINVSAIVGDPHNDGIRFVVRDEAIAEHTENGAHLHAGHASTVVITKEQALELADSIREHYGEEDAKLATAHIANGLTLGQEENASTEVAMPSGTVDAALPDGRNAPSPQRAAPLGRGFDVVAEQPPHLHDHELGGRDPGDEDPFDNIPF